MSLTEIAATSIIISIICLCIIAIDIANHHSQPMWIMNIVWPVTALYAGPIGLFVYFNIRRSSSANKPMIKEAM